MQFNFTTRVLRVSTVFLVALLAESVAAWADVPPDFDNDGLNDLAVGVAGDVVNGQDGAGLVHLFNGHSGQGLDIALGGSGSQDTPNISDSAETNDHFADTMAWGDFNGDGYTDLAIGVPNEDIGAAIDAGAVHVVYGGSESISTDGAQFFTQNTPSIPDVCETGDRFGMALAAGDFDNDGYCDLAIGVPFEDRGSTNIDAGVVHELYGSAAGLRTDHSQLWTQDKGSILDVSEVGDLFGLSLAVGDFNNDGRDDLVVGAPYEDLAEGANGGAVHVIYGGALHLTSAGNQRWTQNSPGIANTVEADDHFGLTLCTGDFNGDGASDLAIGVPDEDMGPARVDCGVVHVLYSSAGELRANNDQLWWQNVAGVQEQADPNDRFGFALASGDVDNDSRNDLLVGVPNEMVGGFAGAGAVQVFFGSPSGLTEEDNELRSQNSPGVVDASEAGDGFGQSLFTGDFDGDGFCDVAIGVPFEDLAATVDAGAVHIIFGDGTGLASAGAMFIHQDTPGIDGTAQAGDNFGGNRLQVFGCAACGP